MKPSDPIVWLSGIQDDAKVSQLEIQVQIGRSI